MSGYVLVQWRDSGEWFVGKHAMGGSDWTAKKRQARKFKSPSHFRQVERELFGGGPWHSADLRFVRIRPRSTSR